MTKTPLSRLILIAVVIFVLIGTKNQLFVIQRVKDTVKTIENTIPDNDGGGNSNNTVKKVHSPEVMEYFNEVVMNTEFDGSRSNAFKWKKDMKIYVEGEYSSELNSELDRIVGELNEIINTIEIEVVTNRCEANMFVYFGTPEGYNYNHPGVSRSRLESNWGYFLVDSKGGSMYVDIYRANDQEQKHLLREELTQSLGLFNDSNKYPESIFYQDWTTTTEYAQIDRELIDMLYNE